jgi:hypothetical protein
VLNDDGARLRSCSRGFSPLCQRQDVRGHAFHDLLVLVGVLATDVTAVENGLIR